MQAHLAMKKCERDNPDEYISFALTLAYNEKDDSEDKEVLHMIGAYHTQAAPYQFRGIKHNDKVKAWGERMSSTVLPGAVDSEEVA